MRSSGFIKYLSRYFLSPEKWKTLMLPLVWTMVAPSLSAVPALPSITICCLSLQKAFHLAIKLYAIYLKTFSYNNSEIVWFYICSKPDHQQFQPVSWASLLSPHIPWSSAVIADSLHQIFLFLSYHSLHSSKWNPWLSSSSISGNTAIWD